MKAIWKPGYRRFVQKCMECSVVIEYRILSMTRPLIIRAVYD